MPLPPHALLGECGEHDLVMPSGDTCSLRCEDGFGLTGSIQTDDKGDVAPTFPYFRDTVVCFDGTLEIHQFTCEALSLPAEPVATRVSICHPTAAKITSSSGFLVDGSGDENYATNTDCGVVFEAPDGNTVAIRFDAFDVGSNDRVDLHDGPGTT